MCLSKDFLEQAEECISDYIKATIPIFTVKTIEGKRKTSYVGSSFYVNYKDDFFIITANHVFNEANPLLVPLSDKRIESLMYDNRASLTNVNYDLTILKLPKQLEDRRFIPYELYETELMDNFLEPRLYVALGFPGSKVRFHDGKMNGHFKLFLHKKKLNKNMNVFQRMKMIIYCYNLTKRM